MNRIISILIIIGLLTYGSLGIFHYAYAVDNNCMINPIHILQIRIPLGCIEERLDALENKPSSPIVLCSTTAVGGETSLTCTLSQTAKVLYIQMSVASSGADSWAIRFNADSGSNYAQRISVNNGADVAIVNQTSLLISTVTANKFFHFFLSCENILSTQEKYCVSDRATANNGAGNAPDRTEFVSKWANTSSNITSIQFARTGGTGTMNVNSNIIVWGSN